jgi:TRAP-type C4-dicarboxylate transport system permease large subunit
VSYSIVVLVFCWLRPDVIPPRVPFERQESFSALTRVMPVLALVFLVFGGLFTGRFTAIDAGAVGALGTIFISSVTGRMSYDAFRRSVVETVSTPGSLQIIGIGTTMFTRLLGLSGLSSFIATAVSGSDLFYGALMLIIVSIYLIFGTFMKPFGAMLVTLPVFVPMLESQNISLVWFGVLVVKLLEIGMITPPVGMDVFVIKNGAGKYVTVSQVFLGVIPFILADLVVLDSRSRFRW